MSKLNHAISQFVETKTPYYKQWLYEEPIVIGHEFNERLQSLQKIMFRLIKQFVTNYSRYEHLMPVTENVKAILNCCNEAEYKVGTYRTDFVFDQEGSVKIIEITCRFAFNGMFLSSILNEESRKYLEMNSKIEQSDLYTPFITYLESKYLNNVTNVYILKGNDLRNESKIYESILTNAGYNCQILTVAEIENKIFEIKDELIISELSFDEILSLPLSIIKELSKLNFVNDLRTIFLIHDKRFFSVLGNEDFLKDTLNDKEISFFKEFYIPSFSYNQPELDLDDVIENKDKWIIKHRALGKSQSIYAGVTLPPEDWKKIFKEDLTEMTFQHWIPQKTIQGKIGNQDFDDYVTGTLLFYDDNYFGFGDFRTSSFPVTNKVDHRKAFSVILKKDSDLQKLNCSNKFM